MGTGKPVPEIALVTKIGRSGTGWMAQMLAQAIAAEGARIAFVAPPAEPTSREPSHPNVVRIVIPRELVDEGTRIQRTVASLRRVAAGFAATVRLRTHTRVFIFSIPEPLVFALPLFAFLRITGAKLIFIVHDAEPHAWRLARGLRWLERAMHGLSYRLASSAVALTPSTAEVLAREFRVPAHRLRVIPHGPFALGPIPPLPWNGRLLVVGSLRRNKSVRDVIEGVSLARARGIAVQLVLAGQPLKEEPGYWDECRAAIARDPEGFDVRIGFVPDEHLPQLVGDADALILAYGAFSSQSGVGVLAALAARPVIATTSGGLAELFAEGMVGEIIGQPVTPEQVASAIVQFYGRSPDEWRRRAAVGKGRLQRSWTWASIALEYIALARN